MKEFAIDHILTKFDSHFAGLSSDNCTLILKLLDTRLLIGKATVIIEPESKLTNYRTFFFVTTEANLSKLIIETLVGFRCDSIEIRCIAEYQIKHLHYYLVKGIDPHIKTNNILRNDGVTFFNFYLKKKLGIKSSDHEARLEKETFHEDKVFESRSVSFLFTKRNQRHLFQSSYDWKIKSTTKTHDPSLMAMMDSNDPQNNFIPFIYILLFDNEKSFINQSKLLDQKLVKEEAHLILENFEKKLGASFEIIDFGQGAVPISSTTFNIDYSGKNWVNMGVREEIQKCTTGYAFHEMIEDEFVQMEAIKNSQFSKRNSRKQRFLFYDRLLVKITNEKPENGKIIFDAIFRKVTGPKILSFLRDKTNILKKLSFIFKLPKRAIIEVSLKYFLHLLSAVPVLVMPFLFTILTILLSQNNYENISSGILILGFLTFGLAHGALDHLTYNKIISKNQLFYFVANYLVKSAILGLFWVILPDIALLIFIGYSAWHFGQADFMEWRLHQGWQSFLWGFIVLWVILFFHFEELNWILQQIPNLQAVRLLKKMSETQLVSFQAIILVCGFSLAAINKSKHILFTLTYLLLSSMLPLLVSFGIYFVGQHSIHGWRHLQIALNEQPSRLWLKSLPFSIGATIIILCVPFFAGPNYVGVFFMLLSCLSMPHVIRINRFYSKLK